MHAISRQRARAYPQPVRLVVGVALDLLLLIMVALGITDVFAHGFPLFNLWHFPKFGDDEFLRSVNAWHGLVANIIAAVALFHSAAALFHHHVIKDGVLRRMWPTSTER